MLLLFISLSVFFLVSGFGWVYPLTYSYIQGPLVLGSKNWKVMTRILIKLPLLDQSVIIVSFLFSIMKLLNSSIWLGRHNCRVEVILELMSLAIILAIQSWTDQWIKEWFKRACSILLHEITVISAFEGKIITALWKKKL